MTTYARDSRLYQQYQVQSAQPLELVVLSYEKAMACIAQARRSIDVGSIEGRSRHINQACAIIADLQGSLDMDRGAEVAFSLHRLYNYLTRRLCEANAANDLRVLEECHNLLATLWSAWREIAQRGAGSGAATPQPVSARG